MNLPRRFHELYEVRDCGYETPCWVWQSYTSRGGYARSHGRGVHRLAYVALVGPIPPGLELDHLCRVRRCVNPAHLEPVTPRENRLRGVGLSALNAVKTHCVNGHPFDDANTYVKPSGSRSCRTCNAEDQRRFKARHKAAA